MWWQLENKSCLNVSEKKSIWCGRFCRPGTVLLPGLPNLEACGQQLKKQWFFCFCFKLLLFFFLCCTVEFPAVLLNTSSGEIESEFHRYVQPQEHTKLSEFCKELTGITQVCPERNHFLMLTEVFLFFMQLLQRIWFFYRKYCQLSKLCDIC